MNLIPNRTYIRFLCFCTSVFLLNLSCNKDEDMLLDAVLSKDAIQQKEQNYETASDLTEDDVNNFKEEGADEVKIQKSLVSRTTIFKPVQDAYVQNGKGFNQHIIRLDENRRTGYLMFDLSQIDSIGGEITSATLKFVINQDAGNGKIKVYKGESQNWSEDSLSEASAPSKGVQLGEIQQDYDLNTTIGIGLNHREMLPTYSTLILGHFEGNDIAFASKENNRIQASQLEVTYNAPMNSDVIEDEQGIPESEQPTEETEEVDTTTEEPVEETTEEETVEEQPMDEETGEVDTTTEEPVKENTEEETVEEQPMDEETGEVDTTTEEPVEEPTTEEPDQEPVLPIEPSNSPPMAKADASPLSGFAPLDVTFSSTNSTDDKAITTFQWSFQDGNTVSQADVDHTFTEPGTYKVVLKVSDEEGLTATDEVTITVKEVTNEAPVAIATANISSGPAPLEVNFTGSNSTDDNSVNTYKWDFGDGSTSSKADPTHNFSEPGSYKVQLKVSDEAGLTDTDELTITIEEISNEAPIAKASANSTSGTAPLTIDFKGSNSTDDTAVSTYYWNFQDGSTSTDPDPSHTFDSPGTYEVTLSVEDEGELSDIDTITITVDAPVNEPPMAKVAANIVTGDAPLEVTFMGSGSSDDNGIVTYHWDFQDGAFSDQVNTSHVFNIPGVYNVPLTVTDEGGLTNTDAIMITVNEVAIDTGNIDCSEGGGHANETGSKIWCWDNLSIPDYSGKKGVGFSNGELYTDSQCYEKQVAIEGNRLRFRVNPTDPSVGSWCSEDYNMRAEVRTAPWDVRHPEGTEEWFGWTYTFGNDYIIDKNNQWLFFQVHNGVRGLSPHVELMVIKDNQFNGHSAGEIFVVNNATSGSKYNPTGITPRAGNKLDIVVHAIWGGGSKGKFRVWINGNKIHDKQEATIYASQPWGGNAKWGIYKWPWRNEDGVVKSQQQGLTHVETYMGTLRMITRRPGDVDYGKDSYNAVAPD